LLLFLAGFVIGLATLTQPSMALFPAVILIYTILRGQRAIALFTSMAVVVFGMALVMMECPQCDHGVGFGEFPSLNDTEWAAAVGRPKTGESLIIVLGPELGAGHQANNYF
jgi:hypothetical protein